jgi:hypothetical protein
MVNSPPIVPGFDCGASQDSKLSKQTERLHGLGELLEERDVQLAELTSARRDREKLRVKLADLEVDVDGG